MLFVARILDESQRLQFKLICKINTWGGVRNIELNEGLELINSLFLFL